MHTFTKSRYFDYKTSASLRKELIVVIANEGDQLLCLGYTSEGIIMDTRELRREFYYFSYRVRNLFWLFTLIVLVIEFIISIGKYESLIRDKLIPFISFFQPESDEIPNQAFHELIQQIPLETLDGLIQYFLGLWIILALIWLAFPAWFSLKFRYLAWWISQGMGITIRWLFSGWRPIFFLLISVSTVLVGRKIIIDNTINSTIKNTMNYTINDAQYEWNNLTTSEFWIMGLGKTWTDILMPDFLLKVFAISALVVLIYWAYQSRRCIVIPQFTNQTGDDKLKSAAEGVSSLLLNELARLVNLYRMVDDTDPFNPASQGAEVSIDPNINVSGVGETLKSAVTSDSKVKLGVLEVPIGAIMSVLGMAVEGPRLTGSLHKEGDNLILIAKISGGGLKGEWHVSSPDFPKKDVSSGDPLSRMIRQLAYRIFTELEQERLGSPRWKAICHYTDGLRAYRETLRTDRDKMPQLRRAEKAFLMALGEDKKFLKCYYNLGVVYRALKQPESALSVLNESVDPYQPESYLSKVYYALAQNHSWIQTQKKDAIKKMEKTGLKEPGYKFTLQDTDYKFTLQLCDLALRLQPEDAKAWDLMGMMKRRMMEQELLYKPLNRRDHWKTDIIPVREIATALSWRNICCCALKGKVDKSSKNIATTCTRNLAVAYSQANPAFGKPFFNQAIHLAPTDAELHIELGKTLESAKMWREAARSFENALTIEQRPLFWSYLALINAKLYEKEMNRVLLRITSKLKSYNGSKGLIGFKDHPISTVAYLMRRPFFEPVQNHKRSALNAYRQTMNNAYGLKEETYTLEQIKDATNTLTSCLLDQLDKKNNENDADYKKRLEELKQEQSDWDWGYAQVLLELTDIELKNSNLNQAKKLFTEALNKLKKDQPTKSISDLLSQMDRKNDENDIEYKKRLEELKQEQSDWDWGYTQVLLQLSDYEGNKDKAKMIGDSIIDLERNHPLEINYKGLYGKLALAFKDQNMFGHALYNAQRSVASNPERSWDRGVLSTVYQSCQSVEEARSQLEICLSTNPTDLVYLQDMANSQLQFIFNLYDKEKQQNALKSYVEILRNLLELVHSEWINDKKSIEKKTGMHSWAHFWLGCAYCDLNNYDTAISNLSEARKLSDQSEGRSHLVARLYLGKAYFDFKAYSDCEDLFNELIEYIEEKEFRGPMGPSKAASWVHPELENHYCISPLDTDFWLLSVPAPNDVPLTINLSNPVEKYLVGSEFGITLPLGYLIVDAYLSLSFSYAQRDANLIKAYDLAEKAEVYIKNLEDKSLKANMEAMHADRKGWILYKQAKLEDSASDIERAICCLEEAVCKRANPEYYLHLALALEYLLEIQGEKLVVKNGSEAEFLCRMHRALACCDHVTDLDFQQKYTEKAKELKKRLTNLEGNHSKAKTTTASEVKSEPDIYQGYV